MENSTDSEKKSFFDVIRDAFQELRETFSAFFKAPRELWGINVPYVLEGLVYFGILTILGKFCSENLGLKDTEAGIVYSLVTGGITFSMLLLGGYSDKIGIKNSLIIALAAMMMGRILLGISGTFGTGSGLFSPSFFIMAAGLLIMVVGYGLYQPAAYAGIKKYTDEKTSAIAYAALYGFMNLGAFFSGFISSFTRQSFETEFPPNGVTAVFWVYVLLTLTALLFTLFLLRVNKPASIKISDEAPQSAEIPEKTKINNWRLYLISSLFMISLIGYIMALYSPIFAEYSDKAHYALIAAIIALGAGIADFLINRPEHPFRDLRFTFFIFVLIPVQTLFAHNWLTIPYYLNRAFEGNLVSDYFEVFSNINPILIFFLAPIVAGLTARANIYKMMIYGTIVMAAPTFLLTLGPNVILFLIYILVMTIGEAMWQPRFLQWIAEIAPPNQTGLYMGVGQFPWFLTKLLTGLYSGWFLMQYCPLGVEPSAMNTEFMWLIYGAVAMITPIGLILAQNWMKKNFRTKHSN